MTIRAILLVVFLTASVTSGQELPIRPLGRGQVPGSVEVPAGDRTATDKGALDSAGLKSTDPAGLLDYIRARTLSDTDLSKIQGIIKRLGSDDFDERLKAANEVERYGPAAVGPLRAAFTDSDYEVAYRARECLKRMEKVSHAEVAAAAVRALAQAKHPEAAKVLLAFLPMADTPAVVEEIRATLTTLAVRDGKPDPAIVEGLKDGTAIRRAAAAVALIEGDRAALKEAYPKVFDAAKIESDPETKFQMVFPMLTAARDKQAVALLLDVLPDLPRGRLWQAEDYLVQLAGKDKPKATFGRSKESLVKARDTWKEWWDKGASATDMHKFTYKPQVTGRTLIVLYDQRYGTPGGVAELGPDLKERWRIHNLSYPMDAVPLTDGTFAIAEQSSARVTIRNTKGDTLETRSLNGNNRIYGNPQHVEVLPNGNYLVTCQNVVAEFKKDKDEIVWSYLRNNHDVRAACRLPSGETMLLCQTSPNFAIFLDDKGKETATKKLKVGMPNYAWGDVVVTGTDRVLVTEMNQVVEYDLKENKPVWSKPVNQPRSVQRLANGNTLIVDGAGRLVEYAPDGEDVWSYQVTDGPQLYRALRR